MTYFCKIEYKYYLARITHDYKNDFYLVADYIFADLSKDQLIDKKFVRELVINELYQINTRIHKDVIWYNVKPQIENVVIVSTNA